MNILVTGGSGFLGKHLIECLESRDHAVSWVDSRTDLRDQKTTLASGIDCVFHLAARVGGIGANQQAPADFWRDNLLMGIYAIEACRFSQIKKLIMVGTTCSYPKHPKTIPFVEHELFDGYPEETNAPYGIAKRALLAGTLAYRAQYGMNIVTAIPTNLYGPGDHFDLEKSHVIPAMIRKYSEAKERKDISVTLWGTGVPTRDFLYVKDCADALVRMLDYDDGNPVNLGSGNEITTRNLARTISRVVGFDGTTKWDVSKPDGQPRRCLDGKRAKEHLGWEASTSLSDGLTQTVKWYQTQKVKA